MTITKIIVVNLTHDSYRLDCISNNNPATRSVLDFAASEEELSRKLEGAKPKEYRSRLGKVYKTPGIEIEKE